MPCTSCGIQNPAGGKFCGHCGARLALACPSCGTPHEPDAAFCNECGTRLAAGVAPAAARTPVEPPPAATPIAERRLVSILFADLVGFTALAEDRDPEETRELLSRYFELAAEVIGRYGGTVEKFIGDAVMAVWGAPRPARTTRSARSALASSWWTRSRSLGQALQARAGVLTGEAAVTLGATNQGMVAGDLVNTASRLQSAAAPGTVLVGEATQRAASKAIAFEAAGDQALKGKAAPVPAWRALRVVAERGGRSGPRRSKLPSWAATTSSACSRTSSTRRAGSDGPPRLGDRAGGNRQDAVSPGSSRSTWTACSARCSGTRVGPRRTATGSRSGRWARWCGRGPRLAESDDEATTRERIAATVAEYVPDATERRWVEPALLTLLGLESGIGSEELFGAWRLFFERLAAASPVVMIFEDLHFADAGLLDFIDHLLEWSRAFPIYIVTLARPELLERRPDWGAGKRNFTSLYLEPLSERRSASCSPASSRASPSRRSARSWRERTASRSTRSRSCACSSPERVREEAVATCHGRHRRLLRCPETLTALIAIAPRRSGRRTGLRRRTGRCSGRASRSTACRALTGMATYDLEPRLRRSSGRRSSPWRRTPGPRSAASCARFVQALQYARSPTTRVSVVPTARRTPGGYHDLEALRPTSCAGRWPAARSARDTPDKCRGGRAGRPAPRCGAHADASAAVEQAEAITTDPAPPGRRAGRPPRGGADRARDGCARSFSSGWSKCVAPAPMRLPTAAAVAVASWAASVLRRQSGGRGRAGDDQRAVAEFGPGRRRSPRRVPRRAWRARTCRLQRPANRR